MTPNDRPAPADAQRLREIEALVQTGCLFTPESVAWLLARLRAAEARAVKLESLQCEMACPVMHEDMAHWCSSCRELWALVNPNAALADPPKGETTT